MVTGIELLRNKLSLDHPGSIPEKSDFHVRCIEHVLNLCVKEVMGLVRESVKRIRQVLFSIRSSVKKRDIFNSLRAQYKIKTDLHALDTENRWSSKFVMVRNAFVLRKVIKAMEDTLPELEEYTITETEWKMAKKVCDFLSAPAAETEKQSGSSHVTLSNSLRTFDRMKRLCTLRRVQEDPTIRAIAHSFKAKIDSIVDWFNLTWQSLPVIWTHA